MKKHRSVLFFILWGVFLVVGSAFSAICEVLFFFENGVRLEYPPLADYQRFLLLFYVPFVLVPMLATSCYYATKEKIKWIKIVSLCLMIQHFLCAVAVLIQVM